MKIAHSASPMIQCILYMSETLKIPPPTPESRRKVKEIEFIRLKVSQRHKNVLEESPYVRM